MKLVSPAFLLYFPSASLGFNPPNLANPSRLQPLKMGWITDFYSDRSDDEEDQKKVLSDRYKKKVINDAVKEAGAMKQSTFEQEKKKWVIKKDGIFGFVPTKEMTGVEPHVTQLCATISNQLYGKKSFGDFKLSTKDNKAELLIYDNHGKFSEATPPFAAVVSDKTMILGWRGTNSLSDLLTDVAASPQSSFAWRKHAKTIKAQGPMSAIVQNDVVSHEAELIKEIKARGIKEIVTTGHSLGGSVAQIGHLTLRAQIQDEISPWHELQGVNVRSIAFSGPMSISLIDNASDETDAFAKDLNDNSCNMIFSNDVVPRSYGYLSFCEDFVENSVNDIVKGVPIPSLAKAMFDVRGKVEDLIENSQETEQLSGYLGYLSNYRHLGNQIYYEKEDSKPRVLEDMGAFYKNSNNRKDILRDIKYKKVKFPLEEFMDWHNTIVTGPGLSYPEDQLS
mmetsp:Transcript_2351/g.3453  ORF Transcript_2351/g.3453 Transcript_2351/m.3453 type:complete len:450 (-) Transcript_2351:73-1422(-)|eukprot:CAMPEP_0195519876 /NCGR_PEP_ID=MMETSP0794_2-20130614/15670_1 /TAXON_ID=515487 /ORGANISM="Stephanopyxis turris, Strain CCMP 815" /LENGTH=449 /DNA_ID=CAMNT_0040649109 /DNA_START=40 /DNA_END=1389 /DNA_ORIENTATION=-